LEGALARDSRHGALAEFAHDFGLLEAVCDKVLIFRPPLGLLCLSLEWVLFLSHSGSPLAFSVVELNQPLYGFERLFRKDAVASQVVHIRFVPIELNFGPIHVLS
jgi:hypothetical protein